MYRWTLCIAVMFLAPQAVAAGAATAGDPLFASDELLQVTIAAPLTSIMKERPLEEYVPGSFSYAGADGNVVEFEVGLRTRGRFRRRVEVCNFAPLRINFRKSETKGTLFDKQDKLKLVTHCENRSPKYQQSVVSEYLAYRVLNLLSDISFRARLLEVTYVDTDRKDRETKSYAIFIEHSDRMAKRIDTPRVTVNRITVSQLVPEYAGQTALYQYFLGNTDFSQIATAPGEDCCHNHQPFGAEGEKIYSVPYDFDMTGFVNAPHAQPNERFRLRSVRERLYRGRCVHNQYLAGAITKFKEQRDAIYSLISEEDRLTDRNRRLLIRFVDDFFEDIESDKQIEKEIHEACL